MKVMLVVGARPQFVKAAVVCRAMRATPGVEGILVHTGQHYNENMSEIFFEELEIPKPDYNLGVGSGLHGAQTGRMMEALEQTMLKEQPDWVLVEGDTNSTIAGALAAVKLHIPLGHIESGLRSFNRQMPEEVNRIVTDHVSDLLFPPTTVAIEHLRHEGLPEDKIFLVGDVLYDAALYYGAKAERESKILDRLELRGRDYILATVHRAENTDDPANLRGIFGGLFEIATEIPVVIPLHPRTRGRLEREHMLQEVESRLRVIEPVGYLDMIMLEKNARVIAIDSGGIQKEAFFYRVPCVTLRTETEWVETVELGWNRLAPELDNPASVAQTIRAALTAPCGSEATPYGTGNASELIIQCLIEHTPPRKPGSR